MSRCCIVACARGSGQKWSWREKGERQSEREEIPTPFPMAIGDVVSAPVSHVSKKRISGFRDFTWPSLMFSLCCVLLGWFFYTFMFLFIKICTNLTSFKKTQNTQPGHTQRSRHSARSLFGRWSTETSARAQEGMRQGRGKSSRERVNKQMRNRLNPARLSGNECWIYPRGDRAGLLILQSHQSLVKGCSFRVVTPWSS